MKALTRYRLMVIGLRYRATLRLAHYCIDTRPTDRYIVAHPRSGSTWLRTIFSNLVYPERPSDPDVYNTYMPSVALRRLPLIWRSASPRLMVSHAGYIPGLPRVVLLVRDGRDAIVSTYHYLVTRRKRDRVQDFAAFFSRYMLGAYGPVWHKDVLHWLTCGQQELKENLLVVRFEDMKADPSGVVSQIATFLDIAHTSAELEKAIHGASIETMRVIEQQRITKDKVAVDTKDASFYRGGKTGQWQDYFTPVLERAFFEVAHEPMKLMRYVYDTQSA